MNNNLKAVNSDKKDLLFVAGDMPDGVFKLFNKIDYSAIPTLKKTMLISVIKTSIKEKFILKDMIGLMQNRKFDDDMPTDLAYCLNVIDYEKTNREILKNSFIELRTYINKHLKLKDNE